MLLIQAQQWTQFENERYASYSSENFLTVILVTAGTDWALFDDTISIGN